MIFPNINIALPVKMFNDWIQAHGMAVQWMKSHQCPCTYATSSDSLNPTYAGAADVACLQCGGYGTYWDAPSATFNVFLTFRHLSQSPDEPGVQMNPQFGPIMQSSPVIDIPFDALSGKPWTETGYEDAFIEVDSVTRYQTTLVVGGIQAIPYQRNLTSTLIAATGAVTTYDTQTHLVSPVSGYTVTGGTVTLPPQYGQGTPYTVEFYCNPMYFVFKKAGGMPHVRPPGAEKLPRGYHVMPLDLWTRARTSNSFSPQSP